MTDSLTPKARATEKHGVVEKDKIKFYKTELTGEEENNTERKKICIITETIDIDWNMLQKKCTDFVVS
jgi:hypothetical protein